MKTLFHLTTMLFTPPFDSRRKSHTADILAALINRGIEFKIKPNLNRGSITIFVWVEDSEEGKNYQELKKSISMELDYPL